MPSSRRSGLTEPEAGEHLLEIGEDFGAVWAVLDRSSPDEQRRPVHVDDRESWPDGYVQAYGQHPYLDACDSWDVGEADSETAEPVRSDVPVLVEVGTFDPVTRVDEVTEAVAGLSYVSLVEVPSHSYNVFGFYECPRDIRRGWLDDSTAEPADTRCLDTDIADPFG